MDRYDEKFVFADSYDTKILREIQDKTYVVGECWRYGGFTNHGYGWKKYRGKQMNLQRIIAHLFLDFDLNSGDYVLHKPLICKFRDCWRPSHLKIGNHTINMQDKFENTTHCRYGHEYTEENTLYGGSGGRFCRICNNERLRTRRGSQ